MITQELEKRGEEITLVTHANTNDAERENWAIAQVAGKGFIRGENGELQGRTLARIPVEDAEYLDTVKDLDWLAYRRCGDMAAFRRLLRRYPYWRCSEGAF